MTHGINWLRFAALGALLVVFVASAPTHYSVAQDVPTDTPAATGTLTVTTSICTRDDQATGTITVVAQGATSGLTCSTGDPASISIDGGGAVTVNNGDQLQIAAGSHTVTESSQGSSLPVNIADGAETVIEVTTAQAPAPTAAPSNTPAPTPTTPAIASVQVVTHLCREDLDADQLAGLDWTQQLVACPGLTLPANYGDVGPDDVSANDPGNPRPYDVTIAYQSGGSATNVAIADASFQVAHLCESDLGANLNGVANDDRCWDISGYQVDDVDPGAITITTSQLPAGFMFGIARTDPASDDDAALGAVDSSAGTVQVDTSADQSVVIHLFQVAEPSQNRITIVSHLCGGGITSRSAFTAIGDFWAQINACPSIVQSGDVPAPGTISSGAQDFAVEVEGADLVKQQISAAQFVQRGPCEADLPADVNGNPDDNICLDLSAYEFANVSQGAVTVRAGSGPAGSVFVGTGYVPDSGDNLTQTSVGSRGTIKLDTSGDGHVTIHLFFGPEPPPPTPSPTRTPTKTPTSIPAPGTKTPTPTRTPATEPSATETPGGPTATPTSSPQAGTGVLQIFKFWCDGDVSLTRINALAPGADATRDDLGDATCANGNSDFILFDVNGNQIRTVSVPPLGVLLVDNLPATVGSQRYSLQDTRSSATGSFQILAGVVTKVISLHYQEAPEIPDPPIIPTIDLPEDPPDIPDTVGGDPEDEEGDFNFGGPVAVPDGSNPFTVVEDPEAAARVESVDSFEELPGVGIGDSRDQSHRRFIELALALAGAIGLCGARIHFLRARRRNW